mmetsp:Transcript_55071/g.108755  ORF Transcript_55071/g.108755 Transcript_55071/m.108755 type:complete len:253 (-) Transcript_55071:31-789(-)
MQAFCDHGDMLQLDMSSTTDGSSVYPDSGYITPDAFGTEFQAGGWACPNRADGVVTYTGQPVAATRTSARNLQHAEKRHSKRGGQRKPLVGAKATPPFIEVYEKLCDLRSERAKGQDGGNVIPATKATVFGKRLCPYSVFKIHVPPKNVPKVISLGSVGHPNACAEPCEDNDCMDPACRKCHQCGPRRLAGAREVGSCQAECGSDCPSVGSLGHPNTCASPCKYQHRGGNCKDGRMCVRCHLCKWSRPRRGP